MGIHEMKAFRFFHPLSFAHFDRVGHFLLLLVFGGVIQRYYWRGKTHNLKSHEGLTNPPLDIEDPFKCNGLLNEGHWLDPGPTNTSSTFQNWQPLGCMMHKYTKGEIEQCLAGQKVIIAGDSTSRQLFETAIEKMGHKGSKGHQRRGEHVDAEWKSGTTTVSFMWDPYLNSTSLEQELKSFRYEPSLKNESNPTTGLLFLRAPGLWHARNDGENYLKYFKQNVDRLPKYINPRILKQLGGREESPNLLLMSPMLVPYYDALNDVRKATITPERVERMNDYLHEASANGKLPIIRSFSSMLAGSNSLRTHDEFGLHLVSSVAHAEVDVLLNLRCNAKLATRGYPYDRTCCMSYKKPAAIQFFIILGSIFMFLFMAWKWSSSLHTLKPGSKAVENFKAVLKFLLVLCFCFLADRTHVFEVGQKQFFAKEFGISCMVVLILGLVSMMPVKKPSKQTEHVDDLFLSRDQTDEWKGWMQALILLYHYLGASQSLGTYKVIRLLVSSYLFMTGYGHTLSLLQNADFSFKKVSAVILRLNMLTVTLSYVMETNYLFYYFPALSTFWYLVIYLVLRFAHRHNNSFQFVSCKIVLSAFITTTFIRSPVVMGSIGSCLQFLFKINWDIPEWRFRLSLDLYIVYIGMIAALLRHESQLRQKQGLEVDAKHSISLRLQDFITIPSRLSTVLTILLNFGFIHVARTYPNKPSYNALLPYISWIPILGFITLRNSHPLVKSHYSTAFAWLGRISLETYILQYHIWLASDTKGILRMGIFNRGIEAAILTFLFIWISYGTSEATKIVVRQLIEVEEKVVNQNAVQEEGHALMLIDRIIDTENEKVQKNESRNRISSYSSQILEDLRWRMLIIVVMLWLANLLTSPS